jgi:4-diphosphocytidyl-2-C-methyl-D-erythritol kinase
MTILRTWAPAKLNLSLAVTVRRDDGYHELASTFVLLELSDRLLLLPGCSGLRVEGIGAGASVPVDRGRNLAWRGLVAGMGGEPDLVCLALEKRIPASAGLGGGSSDAAAAWRLGRSYAGRDAVPDQRTLTQLAAIGADVPFFAAATPAAWVTGVGERVSPLPAISLNVVLVHPPFGLSTAAVFAELRERDWSGSPAAPPGQAEAGDNDLLAAARRLRPEIDALMAKVVAAGGEPHLTGTGPTIFCLTDDADRAAAIGSRLQRDGLRVTPTRTAAEAATIQSLDDTQEDA